MGRAPCCDKANVKRGPWSPDEDTTLKNYLLKFGTGGNWISLPHRAGLKRCGKSCRLRWLNYLRPDIKLGSFTDEEDNIIISLYSKMGSRWSVIAANLPGRTDNDVKNHWNTKLKKKLFGEPKSTSKFINSSTNPKTTNVTNPTIQIPPSSSTSINYVDNNHNYDFNQDQNHHQLYVPIPSFSSLLTQCTNTHMSLMHNFSNPSNLDHPYVHNPVTSPSSIGNPLNQGQVMFHSSSPFINTENVRVQEEVSSISESSMGVYGSSLEDDPFLVELGFGLVQE